MTYKGGPCSNRPIDPMSGRYLTPKIPEGAGQLDDKKDAMDQEAGTSSAIQSHRIANSVVPNSDDGKPKLSEADMVVFLGDFNCQLHGISYDEARDMVSQRCFNWLREKVQLRAEMKAGKIFHGMHEGKLRFPPT